MSVNYMIEINALNDWELTHPLSATAYKVMCKLYYLANKERFPERMTVSNRVLMSMVGCSEDSLIKARNQLIQSGRIDYKGQKKMTPLYMIHYFSLNNTANNSEISSYRHGIEHGYEHGYQRSIVHGIKHGTYIDNTIQDEIIQKSVIYTDEDIDSLASAIAKKNGHAENAAYIQGVKRNLIRGGIDAIKSARNEIADNGHGYQQHSYTENDFSDSFYYDPSVDYAGVGK